MESREDDVLEALAFDVFLRAGEILEFYGAWQVGGAVEDRWEEALKDLDEAGKALRAHLERLRNEVRSVVSSVVAEH